MRPFEKVEAALASIYRARLDNAQGAKTRALLDAARELTVAGLLSDMPIHDPTFGALMFAAKLAGLDATLARLTIHAGIDSAPKPAA